MAADPKRFKEVQLTVCLERLHTTVRRHRQKILRGVETLVSERGMLAGTSVPSCLLRLEGSNMNFSLLAVLAGGTIPPLARQRCTRISATVG